MVNATKPRPSGNAEASSSKPKKPRASENGGAEGLAAIKKETPKSEPRAAPAFVSTLQMEETDFPRGGGTSLTALEVKQARDEGRREAQAESQAEVSARTSEHEQPSIAQRHGSRSDLQSSKTMKRKKPISERQAKRLKKNDVRENKDQDKDLIRELITA
jgi:rRNA biogenesis protein RRP5